MAVVTISRSFGTGAREIGQGIAKDLGYTYLDKDLFNILSKKMHIPPGELEDLEVKNWKKQKILTDLVRTRYPKLIAKEIDEEHYMKSIAMLIRELADQDNIIIVGRGGQCILAERPDTYHFRLIADMEDRVHFLKKISKFDHVSDEILVKMIEKEDRLRKSYMEDHFHADWDEPSLYHLIINLSRVSVSLAEDLMLETIKQKNGS